MLHFNALLNKPRAIQNPFMSIFHIITTQYLSLTKGWPSVTILLFEFGTVTAFAVRN